MEKVFSFDQEDIKVEVENEDVEVDYSVFSQEDFAAIDETEIDWSDL